MRFKQKHSLYLFIFVLFFTFHVAFANTKIWVVSIPKSGTNLLCQYVRALTGRVHQWVTFVSDDLPEKFD